MGRQQRGKQPSRSDSQQHRLKAPIKISPPDCFQSSGSSDSVSPQEADHYYYTLLKYLKQLKDLKKEHLQALQDIYNSTNSETKVKEAYETLHPYVSKAQDYVSDAQKAEYQLVHYLDSLYCFCKRQRSEND